MNFSLRIAGMLLLVTGCAPHLRANAVRFGGDPDLTTLFGESAGSATTCALWDRVESATASSPAP